MPVELERIAHICQTSKLLPFHVEQPENLFHLLVPMASNVHRWNVYEPFFSEYCCFPWTCSTSIPAGSYQECQVAYFSWLASKLFSVISIPKIWAHHRASWMQIKFLLFVCQWPPPHHQTGPYFRCTYRALPLTWARAEQGPKMSGLNVSGESVSFMHGKHSIILT